MLKTILTAVVMSAVVTIGAVGTVTLSSEQALAARRGEVPVDNSTAAGLYGDCLLTRGHVIKTGSSYDRCCSRSLGYCIKCPRPAGSGTCVRSPYRIVSPIPGGNLSPGGGTLAPAPDNAAPSSTPGGNTAPTPGRTAPRRPAEGSR